MVSNGFGLLFEGWGMMKTDQAYWEDLIQSARREIAAGKWNEFMAYHTKYWIPVMLRCDRALARSPAECYWLDPFHKFLCTGGQLCCAFLVGKLWCYVRGHLYSLRL